MFVNHVSRVFRVIPACFAFAAILFWICFWVYSSGAPQGQKKLMAMCRSSDEGEVCCSSSQVAIRTGGDNVVGVGKGWT
jgi:hypothetical protein